MSETIHQTEHFDVLPEEFYNTFLSAEKHSAFTESKAEISSEVGASFSAYDGYCFGENLELAANSKIVQSWCAHDDKWTPDHMSTITLILTEDGGKTHLDFLQENVPKEAAESIATGWKEFYWEPLKAYFKQQKQ